MEGAHVKGAKPLRWFRVLQDFHPIKERGEKKEKVVQCIILEEVVCLNTSLSLGCLA